MLYNQLVQLEASNPYYIPQAQVPMTYGYPYQAPYAYISQPPQIYPPSGYPVTNTIQEVSNDSNPPAQQQTITPQNDSFQKTTQSKDTSSTETSESKVPNNVSLEKPSNPSINQENNQPTPKVPESTSAPTPQQSHVPQGQGQVQIQVSSPYNIHPGQQQYYQVIPYPSFQPQYVGEQYYYPQGQGGYEDHSQYFAPNVAYQMGPPGPPSNTFSGQTPEISSQNPVVSKSTQQNPNPKNKALPKDTPANLNPSVNPPDPDTDPDTAAPEKNPSEAEAEASSSPSPQPVAQHPQSQNQHPYNIDALQMYHMAMTQNMPQYVYPPNVNMVYSYPYAQVIPNQQSYPMNLGYPPSFPSQNTLKPAVAHETRSNSSSNSSRSSFSSDIAVYPLYDYSRITTVGANKTRCVLPGHLLLINNIVGSVPESFSSLTDPSASHKGAAIKTYVLRDSNPPSLGYIAIFPSDELADIAFSQESNNFTLSRPHFPLDSSRKSPRYKMSPRSAGSRKSSSPRFGRKSTDRSPRSPRKAQLENFIGTAEITDVLAQPNTLSPGTLLTSQVSPETTPRSHHIPPPHPDTTPNENSPPKVKEIVKEIVLDKVSNSEIQLPTEPKTSLSTDTDSLLQPQSTFPRPPVQEKLLEIPKKSKKVSPWDGSHPHSRSNKPLSVVSADNSKDTPISDQKISNSNGKFSSPDVNVGSVSLKIDSGYRVKNRTKSTSSRKSNSSRNSQEPDITHHGDSRKSRNQTKSPTHSQKSVSASSKTQTKPKTPSPRGYKSTHYKGNRKSDPKQSGITGNPWTGGSRSSATATSSVTQPVISTSTSSFTIKSTNSSFFQRTSKSKKSSEQKSKAKGSSYIKALKG